MTNKPRQLTTHSVTESTSRTIMIHFHDQSSLHWCGWASYTINERTGEVTIQSDWGTWAYRWHVAHTGYQTMVEAVCGFSNHYITDKMHYGRKDSKEPDDEATLLHLKQSIIAARRDHSLSADEARDIWDAATEFCSTLEYGNADTALAQADSCLWRFDGTLYDRIRYQPTNSYLMLRDQLIPALQRHLAPEVAALKQARADAYAEVVTA